MQISENILKIKQSIPAYIKIVAVSKTMPEENIMEVYQCGHRIFGENRVQEMVRKQANLPADIEWHFIGHLQTNKVKLIVPFVHTIQSVDSLNLLTVINEEAIKNERIVSCLLQLHIAREASKYGLSFDASCSLLESPEYKEFSHIIIRGLMGMATFTPDMNQVRSEFRYLKECFKKIKEGYFSNHPEFNELSMGMSGDYPIAIEEGATMIRIGSLIFGARS